MKTRIRTGQYDFPNPEWQHVSDYAKELITGMLSVDPAHRLTISQVIKNPWISVSTTYLYLPTLPTYLYNLPFTYFSFHILLFGG